MSLLILFSFSCAKKKKVIVSNPTISVDSKVVAKKVKLLTNIGPSKKNTQKFKEMTKSLGLDNIVANNLYPVDVNSDGYTDLVLLSTVYDSPKFYLYNPKLKKFEKMSSPAFRFPIRASFLAFADFNKDGIYDLLVGTLNQKTELSKEPLRLFKGNRRGNNPFYIEIKNAFPKKIMPTATVSFIDFDLDGHLDVFAGNWFDYSKKRPTPTPDRLFKGKFFNFKDVSYLLNEEHKFIRSEKRFVNARPTFGVSTCDLDQNGFPDILTSSSSGYHNKLWMNLKDSKRKGERLFKDTSKVAGFACDPEGSYSPLSGGKSFYSACTDYNNDGIMDVALGELYHSYDSETSDRSSILTGSELTFPPKFIRTEYHEDDGSGNWSQGDKRGFWADYNRDSLDDLFVDNSGFPPKSRLILFHQHSDHSFQNLSPDLGIDILNPVGSVFWDPDRDGRLDILSGQTNIRNSKIKPKLWAFQNIIPFNGNRSIRFYLKGKLANANGIGATIVLNTSKGTQRKFVQYSYGPLPSQLEEGMFFGLGQKNKIDSVEVKWPFLVKDKAGRGTPLVRKYNLKSFNFKYHVDVTLCDSGRLYSGRKTCN